MKKKQARFEKEFRDIFAKLMFGSPAEFKEAKKRVSKLWHQDLNAFKDALYKIEGEDLFLIPTAEHAILGMLSDKTISEEKLPLKFFGYSMSFRKEIGSHGINEKGLWRTHQFNKVEQFIFCKPEDSWKLHEELIKNAIEFFTKLGLHFRQVNVCTGDIGIVAAKKYDLEAFYPVQDNFREVVSCSNCTSYQSIRLNMKYNTSNGNEYIHTLNSTVVATTRALVAILENYQQKDGSVKIPSVLVPFMNGIKEIRKRNN